MKGKTTKGLSEKDFNKWVEMYNEGISSTKIGEQYGLTTSTVIYWLKKYGVTIRSNKQNSIKYRIEHANYFENIDTEAKAYFLGFIYADGYVAKRRDDSGAMGISIGVKDRGLLEALRKQIGCEHPINEYEVKSGYNVGGKYCRLFIISGKLYGDLINQGVVHNKTDILRPPENVPQNLLRHFIRGYMDGDGSIKITDTENTAKTFEVNFCGTDAMLDFISEYLFSNGLINKILPKRKRAKGQIVSNINYGGNFQSQRVLDHLYNDSHYFLPRKFKRYLDLKQLNGRIYE